MSYILDYFYSKELPILKKKKKKKNAQKIPANWGQDRLVLSSDEILYSLFLNHLS